MATEPRSGAERFPAERLSLADVQGTLLRAGCRRLYVKELAWNHDSKRQIYLSSDLSSFNTFPHRIGHPPALPRGVVPTQKKKNKDLGRIFGHLSFRWITCDGSESPASDAKLIYYPQYPEVRLSGFLRGVDNVPSRYLCERSGETFSNRLLFLGVRPDGVIIAFLAVGQAPLRSQLRQVPGYRTEAGLNAVPLNSITKSPRQSLLDELRRIHRKGVVPGQRLRKGRIEPYSASNAVGYTLEAHLGIEPNGDNQPDYSGWEVKAHTVIRYGRSKQNSITVFTPEPDMGVYKSDGSIEVVRRWGYPDRKGRSGRHNFGGVHRVGTPCSRTSLCLVMVGYDVSRPDTFDTDGYLALMSPDEVIAAGWSFKKLVECWCRKHAAAAYVPAVCTKGTAGDMFQYRGPVLLCEDTDFARVLAAMQRGLLFIDPALKVEFRGSERPATKNRNQFRIKYEHVPLLYRSAESVEL